MKTIIQQWKNVHLDSKAYFADFAEEIMEDNLVLLVKASTLALLFFILYFVLFSFYFVSSMLALLYCGFFLGLVGLTVTVQVYRKRKHHSFLVIENLCLGFIALMIGFVITIGVFPFPENPSVFFTPVFLAMSIIFILPYWKINLLLSVLQIVYLLLCIYWKSPYSLTYDVVSGVTAWGMSMALSYLVLSAHIREGKSKRVLETAYSTDAITGLPNRYLFNRHMEKSFVKCKAENLPMAILMMDVDNFKIFNDTYGHVAGDDCLHHIGMALSTFACEEDVFLARYGGEELVAVLTGDRALEAEEIAQAILYCMETCAIPSPTSATGYVTISIGVYVTTNPQEERSALEMIGKADEALYQAKDRGKNQYVIYGIKEQDA